MAQRTQVIWVDDVDGSEATQTITFGLDGSSYEIDLSDEHATSLREALASWIGHARKAKSEARSAVKARSGGRARAASSDKPDLGAVRAWARENGFSISDRGRVSGQVLDAYDAAH